ncbi:hypothetical protein BJY04DRAFT_199941 [Aspergillus karnatakaensis]|uniref:uncharacterized protein n=1 Tax=Aspergillus karnatakaensis TaxID=1810916 RepID=UPI003CCDCB98
MYSTTTRAQSLEGTTFTMRNVLKISLPVLALGLLSACSALAVPVEDSASMTAADVSVEEFDAAVVSSPQCTLELEIAYLCQLELYKPTDDERARHSDRLWYFDHPELFLNDGHNYYLTNDFGASSPYLVEATNSTHWQLQERAAAEGQPFETRAVSYVNSYIDGGCIGDSFRQQISDPTDGYCYKWNSLVTKAVFVVGSGNFQVNLYGVGGTSCQGGYLGSVKNWSGCWNSPSSTKYIRAFWTCYSC